MELEPLFLVKVDCLFCHNSFQSPRVRPSFKKSIRRDSDFCHYYKEINPEFYVVRVCPTCGFSTTESFSNKLTDEQHSNFRMKVADSWSGKDYSNHRTWKEALETYKLALLTAQIKGESDRVMAGLLHHIAWMYRYENKTEDELKFLKFAVDAYVRTYETEGVDMNNAKLMYVIGDLHRRLKNFNEAVRWFARVVNDKKIMDASMIRASREAWQSVREDMLALKMEISEDAQLKA